MYTLHSFSAMEEKFQKLICKSCKGEFKEGKWTVETPIDRQIPSKKS